MTKFDDILFFNWVPVQPPPRIRMVFCLQKTSWKPSPAHQKPSPTAPMSGGQRGTQVPWQFGGSENRSGGSMWGDSLNLHGVKQQLLAKHPNFFEININRIRLFGVNPLMNHISHYSRWSLRVLCGLEFWSWDVFRHFSGNKHCGIFRCIWRFCESSQFVFFKFSGVFHQKTHGFWWILYGKKPMGWLVGWLVG